MFRARLQKWGMNDKNRRSAARPGRRALRSERNEDRTSRHGPHYDAISRTSSPPDVLYRENIHYLLQTSKETLVLQRTLKGVLDWQQHAEGSTMDLSDSWTFVDLIKDMERCVLVSDKISPMCETSKSPARVRVARCSAMTPAVYCTGICQPPKSTIFPPAV